MKPSCLRHNPNVGPPPMAFSTGFRLLRCYPNPLPARLSGLRVGVSGLRFLSAAPPHGIRAVKARRGEEEREERDEGNGSLIVRDTGREGRIVPTELHKEATEAYMAYAMSVLLGRALPDVRDGLKPVHRRIL